MKYYLSLLLLIFLPLFIFDDAHSQDAYKFRAKYVCFSEYKYNDWSAWSKWEETNILIVIDIDDERITIFANETHYLDVYDYESEKDYEKSILNFWAIDEDGNKCRVRFIYYEEEDYRQIYIDYPKFMVAYSIKPMFQK